MAFFSLGFKIIYDVKFEIKYITYPKLYNFLGLILKYLKLNRINLIVEVTFKKKQFVFIFLTDQIFSISFFFRYIKGNNPDSNSGLLNFNTTSLLSSDAM